MSDPNRAERTRGATGPTSLYRFYDQAGQLLYVGITRRGRERFHQHARDKVWWNDVATSTVQHYPTREQAEQAERDAIQTEKPAHNIHHAGITKKGNLRLNGGRVYRTDTFDSLHPGTLVGSHFLTTLPCGCVSHQGVVVAQPTDDVYLVEYGSWITGSSTHQELVRIQDMFAWRFYDDPEWRNGDYDDALYHRSRSCTVHGEEHRNGDRPRSQEPREP